MSNEQAEKHFDIITKTILEELISCTYKYAISDSDISLDIQNEITPIFKEKGCDDAQAREILKTYENMFDEYFDKYWDQVLATIMKKQVKEWVGTLIPDPNDYPYYPYEEAQSE